MNYLDKTGVTYLWNKIKNYIANRIVPVSGGVQALRPPQAHVLIWE